MKTKKSNRWENELFNVLYKLNKSTLNTSTEENKSKYKLCRTDRNLMFAKRKIVSKGQSKIIKITVTTINV